MEHLSHRPIRHFRFGLVGRYTSFNSFVSLLIHPFLVLFVFVTNVYVKVLHRAPSGKATMDSLPVAFLSMVFLPPFMLSSVKLLL